MSGGGFEGRLHAGAENEAQVFEGLLCDKSHQRKAGIEFDAGMRTGRGDASDGGGDVIAGAGRGVGAIEGGEDDVLGAKAEEDIGARV